MLDVEIEIERRAESLRAVREEWMGVCPLKPLPARRCEYGLIGGSLRDDDSGRGKGSVHGALARVALSGQVVLERRRCEPLRASYETRSQPRGRVSLSGAFGVLRGAT